MQEGLFVNPKGNEIIKKDNNLIEAKYRLTVHEQRLVLTVLSAITIKYVHNQSLSGCRRVWDKQKQIILQ